MITEWEALQKRYDELSNALLVPDIDRAQRQVLQKEHSYLAQVLAKHHEIQNLQKNLSATKAEADQETDFGLKALFQEEIVDLEQQLQEQQKELEDVLFPPDELDKSSAFIEIRAGTGGQEAALFAADLLRMYSNYALKKDWEPSIVSAAETDLKGFREVVLHLKGRGAYGLLRHESGVHRVQRIPTTETSGRIHTSTVTVAVLLYLFLVMQQPVYPYHLQ